MTGGTINFIIRCIKGGNGVEEVGKDADEAKKKVFLFGKGLTALGGTAGTVGRMLSNVMAGGIWEAGARGVMLVWEKFKELRDAAAQAAREAAKALQENLSRAAAAIEERFNSAANSISVASARAKELLGLDNKKSEVRTARGTANITKRMREDMSAAKSDAEREIIQAKARVEIAKLNAKEQVKRAEAAAKEADKEIDRARKRVKAAEEAEGRASYNKGEAGAAWSSAARAGDNERLATANKTLDEALDRLKKAQERLASEKEKEVSAEIAARGARLDVEKVEIDSRRSVADAENALAEVERKHKEAAEKRRAEEERRLNAAKLAAQIDERERAMLAKAETDSARAVVKAQADRARARLNAQKAETEADKMQARAAIDKAEAALDEARRKHEVAEAERKVEAWEAAREKKARDMVADAMESMAASGRKKLDETNKQIDALKATIKGVKDNAARVKNAISGFGRSTGQAGYLFSDWLRAKDNQDKAIAADEKSDSRSRKKYERLAGLRARGVRLTAKDEQFVSDWEAYADSKRSTEDEESKLAELQRSGNALLAEIRDCLKEANTVN